MMNRKQLCKVLTATTGLDEFYIWRTADALGLAGIIPPNDKSEVLPCDVATLIYAIAAARFPDEAVEVVEAQRTRVTLHAAVRSTAEGDFPVSPEEYERRAFGREFEENSNALDWIEWLITASPSAYVTCRAEIGRGAENAMAAVSFVVAQNGETVFGLTVVYCDGSKPIKPVHHATLLSNDVFLAASLFLAGVSVEHLEGAAAESAAMN